jgi:hypothetical protein
MLIAWIEVNISPGPEQRYPSECPRRRLNRIETTIIKKIPELRFHRSEPDLNGIRRSLGEPRANPTLPSAVPRIGLGDLLAQRD